MASLIAASAAQRAVSQVRWPGLTGPLGVGGDGQNAGSSH